MNIEQQLIEIPANEFNEKAMGWTNLYYALVQYGYFLPPINIARRCLPVKKLLGIINKIY